MTSAVLYEVDGGIARLSLNQPDSRNALSAELMNGLHDRLSEAMTSDTVRVVVLTNEGNTFCAGADLKGGRSPQQSLVDIFGLMADGPKPVVGRIAGHCMGGGVGLAAACDISVVADDVSLGFTEVRVGVAPAVISVVVLAKMRRADALELFLSGERIGAERAAEAGLVNQVVPRERLDEATFEVCDKLLHGGPKALSAAKELAYKVPGMPRDEAFAWTSRLSADLFASDEAKAGMAAFRQRQAPPWGPKES